MIQEALHLKAASTTAVPMTSDQSLVMPVVDRKSSKYYFVILSQTKQGHLFVEGGTLGIAGNLGHDRDGLGWVLALGSFTRKHDAIGAI